MWLGKLRAIIYSDFCFPGPMFSRTWIKTREGCVAILSGMIWFPSFLFTVNILATCIPKILETSRRVLGANANLPKNPFGTQSNGQCFERSSPAENMSCEGFTLNAWFCDGATAHAGSGAQVLVTWVWARSARWGAGCFTQFLPVDVECTLLHPQWNHFFSQNSDKSLTCSVVWKAVARLDRCGNLVH